MSVKNTPFVSNQEVRRPTINAMAQRVIENLPGSAGVSRWLRTRQLQAALRQIYPSFATQNPAWVANLFDQHFLLHCASPMVEHYREHDTLPTPIKLATTWDRQFGPTSEPIRQRRMAEFIPVAANLLELVEAAL